MNKYSPASGVNIPRRNTTYAQPIYFRTGRGQDPAVYEIGEEFKIGKAKVHELGQDVTIIACGMAVHGAKAAVQALNEMGHSVGLINMHTIKPLDVDTVHEAAKYPKIILSVEEHNILGGLGSAVAEVLAEQPSKARLVRHGIMDEYSLIVPPTHLYRHYIRCCGD
ncbi:transketolase C-terminal domain-containing protein [Ochrobactrum sp. MYb379]|uniref:transketolase C-terminal domain-containing protein n=1 Tax=Ochrobactrum sp. MYb379 TaxID=2745275 RepID=UPI0030AF6C34